MEGNEECQEQALQEQPPKKRGRGRGNPNAIPLALVVRPCSRAPASYERHFAYRLNCNESHSLEQHELVLDALVLANGICVLTFPLEAVSLLDCNSSHSVLFDSASESMEIKGKRKKGARKVKAGSPICSLVVAGNSHPVALLSPVSGHLLEINKNLESDGSLLKSQPQGIGYIAVVFPEGEIPSLDNGGVVKPKDYKCHAWSETGACARGSDCKFSHNI